MAVTVERAAGLPQPLSDRPALYATRKPMSHPHRKQEHAVCSRGTVVALMSSLANWQQKFLSIRSPIEETRACDFHTFFDEGQYALGCHESSIAVGTRNPRHRLTAMETKRELTSFQRGGLDRVGSFVEHPERHLYRKGVASEYESGTLTNIVSSTA